MVPDYGGNFYLRPLLPPRTGKTYQLLSVLPTPIFSPLQSGNNNHVLRPQASMMFVATKFSGAIARRGAVQSGRFMSTAQGKLFSKPNPRNDVLRALSNLSMQLQLQLAFRALFFVRLVSLPSAMVCSSTAFAVT